MISHDVRPGPDEVEELYRGAAAGPPLHEPDEVAALFAHLYAEALNRDDVLIVTASDGGVLRGIAYGFPWRWDEQGDPWGEELRERLGDAAPRIDGALGVQLLAVRPDRQRAGLGRRLLGALVESGGPRAWLQTTDVDSPARRLYAAQGWRPIGHGPNAPDGRPGLVLAVSC